MSCTPEDVLACSRAVVALVFVSSGLALAACSSEDGPADHHGHEGDGEIGTTSQALADGDPVSQAVNESCTTAAVKGLSTQLVEEIQCLRPNTLKRIDNTPGLALGAAVFPYLQTPAADALVKVQKARGATMEINSGLRTLPQQYLLYRWYRLGRCNIRLAASPGTSNHESAVAVDVNDNAGWRGAMQNNGFRWLGANDPVHYDFVGGGAVSLRGLSVTAFQRLWNRNHPEDPIAEDGAYGDQTETRLARSPVGGFPKGADCRNAPDGGVDAGPIQPAEVTPVPDATEEPSAKKEGGNGGSGYNERALGDGASGGCVIAGPRAGAGGWALLGVGLVAAAAITRAGGRRGGRARAARD